MIRKMKMADTHKGRPYILPLTLLAISLFATLAFPLAAFADGFPIIAVVHAGKRPEGIAVDTQTHLVYFADESPGLVVAFDPIAGKVVWQVNVGESTTDVQVDSATHRVFATSTKANGGALTILDGATGKVLLTTSAPGQDSGLAIDPARGKIYVSDQPDGGIVAFTLKQAVGTGKLSVDGTFIDVGPHPQGLGVDSRLGRLYVADTEEHVITVLDEQTGNILATIPVAPGPLHPLRVDEAKGRVYIVCSTGQELDVIDSHTNKVIAQVPVSPYPEGVAFNTATGRIYVANEGDNGAQIHDIGTTITVIDGQTFDVLGTLAVGHAPDGVEADPALQRLYVSVEESNAVVEVSDSLHLPLLATGSTRQAITARQTVLFLQQAEVAIIVVMLLTFVGATLRARLRHWHGQGSPQSPRGGVSSHSESHSPPE